MLHLNVPTTKEEVALVTDRCLIAGKATIKHGKVIAGIMGNELKTTGVSILTTGLCSFSDWLHQSAEKLNK